MMEIHLALDDVPFDGAEISVLGDYITLPQQQNKLITAHEVKIMLSDIRERKRVHEELIKKLEWVLNPCTGSLDDTNLIDVHFYTTKITVDSYTYYEN